METFSIEWGLKEALSFYIFLKEKEEGLPQSAAILLDRLRRFLYEHLSIDDMERPEETYTRLCRGR
jgi:hypothetical protein